MSKISGNPNHFLLDSRKLNHVELQKYLGCCLDPLPGLPDLGQGEFTMLPLKKRHPTAQPLFLCHCCG